LAGVGSGFIQSLAAGDEASALRKRDEERAARFDMSEFPIEGEKPLTDTSGLARPSRKYGRPGYTAKPRIRYEFDGQKIVEVER
jgi:hypothetical protein